jgi:hypothetical protein
MTDETDAPGIGLAEQALLVTTDFDEMEFVGTGPLSIGMPFDAPQQFKSMLLAAATCYLWGNSSVDHVLRRYPKMLQRARPTEEERQLQQTLRAAKLHVASISHVASKFGKAKVNWGLWAAEACLARLKISYRAASFLARHGYAFEAATVCRLILEQLAWAYAIRDMTDERLMKTLPTECITDLKKILPSAGRMYGELSNFAHLHPEHSAHYLEFSNGKAAVLSEVVHLRWHLAFDLLNLADWYAVVWEAVAFQYFESPTSVRRRADGALEPIPDRPFIAKILELARAAKRCGAPMAIDG